MTNENKESRMQRFVKGENPHYGATTVSSAWMYPMLPDVIKVQSVLVFRNCISESQQ